MSKSHSSHHLRAWLYLDYRSTYISVFGGCHSELMSASYLVVMRVTYGNYTLLSARATSSTEDAKVHHQC
jgi:hypothetical protein